MRERSVIQADCLPRCICIESTSAAKHKEVRERTGIRTRGFTLIEIMIVMLIIGIIMSLAVLSVNLNQSNILEDEVKRLHSLASLASEEAILQGEEMAIEMHNNGYQFLRLLQSEEQSQWAPVREDKMFRPRCFPPGINMKLELEGEPATLDHLSCDSARAALKGEDNSDASKSKLDEDNKNEIPRIFLLSSGELTPFLVTLTWEEGGEYQLSGDITGKLERLAPDDDEN